MFLSHSRRGKDTQLWKRLLCASLSCPDVGIVYWADFLDLADRPGVHWRDEIETAIRESDKVVCLVDGDFLRSANCLHELKLAYDYEKQAIVVVLDDDAKRHLADGADPPSVLSDPAESVVPITAADVDYVFRRARDTNLLFFRRQDVDNRGAEKLVHAFVSAVRLDLLNLHTEVRLLGRAREWMAADRDPDLLLPAEATAEAEVWQDRREENGTTSTIRAYVSASRIRIDEINRRRRSTRACVVSSLCVLLILAVAMAGTSFMFWRRAERNADEIDLGFRLSSGLLLLRDLDMSYAANRRATVRGLDLLAEADSPTTLDEMRAALTRADTQTYLDADVRSARVQNVRAAALIGHTLATGGSSGRVDVLNVGLPAPLIPSAPASPAASFRCDGEVYRLAWASGRLIIGAAGACTPTKSGDVEAVRLPAKGFDARSGHLAWGEGSTLYVGESPGGGRIAGSVRAGAEIRAVALLEGPGCVAFGGTDRNLSFATAHGVVRVPLRGDLNDISVFRGLGAAEGPTTLVGACDGGAMVAATFECGRGSLLGSNLVSDRHATDVVGVHVTDGGNVISVDSSGMIVETIGGTGEVERTRRTEENIEPISVSANEAGVLALSTKSVYTLLLYPFKGFGARGVSPLSRTGCGDAEAFRCADASPDARFVAGGTYEGSVCVWKAEGRHAADSPRKLAGPGAAKRSMAFSPDSLLLAVGEDAPSAGVTVYDVNAGIAVGRWDAEAAARWLAWNGDRKTLGVGLKGAAAGTVAMWRPNRSRKADVYRRWRGDVSALAWSPDRVRLYAAFTSGDVGVIDARARKAVPAPKEVLDAAHGRYLTSMLILRDGAGTEPAYLVAGNDGVVMDVRPAADEANVLTRNNDDVIALHGLPDGRVVAVGNDRTIAVIYRRSSGRGVQKVSTDCRWSRLLRWRAEVVPRLFCASNGAAGLGVETRFLLLDRGEYMRMLRDTSYGALSEADLDIAGLAGIERLLGDSEI